MKSSPLARALVKLTPKDGAVQRAVTKIAYEFRTYGALDLADLVLGIGQRLFPDDREISSERKKLAFAYRKAENLDAAKQLLTSLIAESKAKAQKSPGATTSADAEIETCIVLAEAHRGWILEKIATIIAAALGDGCTLVYIPSTRRAGDVPDARRYFFMHHQILCHALLDHDRFWRVPVYCFHTHPTWNAVIHPDHTPLFLNEARHTFLQNSRTKEALCRAGADPARLSVVLGGADPAVFVGHQRGNGKIGYVGGYYPRKNPSMLLKLAKAMPDEKFLILGPRASDIAHASLHWPNAPIFAEIVAQPNIDYREAPYAEFPAHFGEIDVFLMLSTLEGGPIPLLEAMMCNCVPVATDTGFARDLIVHGSNGYVAPIDAEESTFADFIRQARRNSADIRSTVIGYTWQAFGAAIAEKIRACEAAG
jgi:glycosyltransferase involved in cell wall biosynthesis